MLDKTLAECCAPVLMGEKASNLFTCTADIASSSAMRHLLPQLGLRYTVLGKQRGRFMVLIYRDSLLQQAFAHPLAQQILGNNGYPADDNISHYLRHLKIRIAVQQDFPHEIGLFLGYPPEDVEGFIIHRGKNFKYCGTWKVYGDVSQAMQLFARYKACREKLVSFIENGGSLQHSLPLAQAS